MHLSKDEVRTLKNLLNQYNPESGVPECNVVEIIDLNIAALNKQVEVLNSLKKKLEESV